jgi:signal transduction histidine kinase
MATKTRTWLLRMLGRILAPGRGEVRALEEAMYLEGVLRFIGLILVTIVAPSLVLAYFAVSAISVEEIAAREEVDLLAEDIAGSFWRQVDQDFSRFEEATLDRLESGRSPLESPRELHPYILLAIQLDDEGELLAPFQADSEPSYPLEYLMHPVLQRAHRLEATAPARAARLYGDVASSSLSPAVRGRAELDRARVLGALGQEREARAVLQDVVERYPTARDPWGFRLGDLARLQLGELMLEEDEAAGVLMLQQLADALLDERWVLGQGGEAAVVRQALSRIEPLSSREWSSRARGLVAERNEALFWLGELEEELEGLPVGRLSSSPVGQIRWWQGERGLWAVTRWSGTRYVFALDHDVIISNLKADVRVAVPESAVLEAFLLPPGDPIPDEALARRSLAPWLADWLVVSVLRDPEALAVIQRRARLQRIGIIGFAIAMMGVGAIFSARLVSRELDVARMKTDFAANVSHELRSPITQIRIKAESLLFGLADTPEEEEEHYRVILRESERLSRLVDNILDYAAIERGGKQYVLRLGSLSETTDLAVESISTALEVRDMVLDINVPRDLPLVPHDSDAIGQCLINLISNAAKYSEAGGWIGVLGRRVEGGIELAVSDHGIGIAPHDLQRIFEPYYRSRDALARRRKGTGIGLTITKYIMEGHGGSISAQSRPGMGSTFTLRFPTDAPPQT